jgi:biotin carboxylase
MPQVFQNELKVEIQRLINLLNLGTSIYNIEARIAKDGKPYIMEVSPRGGGNRLSEVLKYATGQDLIANNVKFALGLPIIPLETPRYDGVWVDLIIHSNKTGVFCDLDISEHIRPYVKEVSLYVGKGDNVTEFNGANQAIGTIFLRFDDYEEAERVVLGFSNWLRIKVL